MCLTLGVSASGRGAGFSSTVSCFDVMFAEERLGGATGAPGDWATLVVAFVFGTLGADADDDNLWLVASDSNLGDLAAKDAGSAFSGIVE
jgi:hypothetical protein